MPAGSLPSVYTVVLNWRDQEATFRCLRSLARIDYPNQHIVVVDNGSTDGSAEILARDPAIALVRNGRNLGFTGGVNAGIRHAMAHGADYVWLMNGDAEANPDVLRQLVSAAEADPRIGLVSPVFHNPDVPAQIEFCLGRFHPVTRYCWQTADPAQARQWAEQFPAEITLLGTALLIRRALIEAIGGLDDRFFAYVEDVDYSLRSSAAGFRNVAVPDAIVLHAFKQPHDRPEASPPYLHYYITRNYLLLWRKLPGPWLFRKAMLWLLHERLTQITRMPGNEAGVEALLAGLWDGLRGISGPFEPGRRMPWPLRPLLRRANCWLTILNGPLFGRRAA
jgi:GT2 family glycosyltransferase